MTTSGITRGRVLFFAIFTISGFSGLIYESIWSHYLKLFLGHAAYAQTLVLAIFMGGMALGSALTAKYSVRIRNLLLGYAIVEAVIGLLGLVFHTVSVATTTWAFTKLLPSMDVVAIAHVAKWTLGALLILPQSILLGATFPLMSGAVMRRFPERTGETLSMLYFTNSLGAAIGVLTSGFFLIGVVGLPGTMLTAALMNLLLALVVWLISKGRPNAEQPSVGGETAKVGPAADHVLVRLMLIGAAVTGAAAFLYEIAWIRMLSLVLGSSTHSFELMLSAFILGIAFGGLWVRRKIDVLADPLVFLGRILAIMAVVALLSLPLYNQTFDMMATILATFTRSEQGYAGITLTTHLIAMLMMMPTTFFCGMTLPVMTNVLLRSGMGERAIGGIYAWNTAGAIVGVIVAVHIAMPTVGIKGIIVLGAAFHLALSLLCFAKSQASRTTRVPMAARAGFAVSVLVAAVMLFTPDPMRLSSGVFRHGLARQADTAQMLFLKHGKTATVSLTIEDGIVTIATNGKPDAAIRMSEGTTESVDEITMTLAGALPIALHPDPQRIANIGFGSGLTTHTLLGSDLVHEVDTIEIEPVMAEAAELGFEERVPRTFADPRSHTHFEDAKTFFALQKKKYDVIVSEPSNPWVSGVATLFSQEFYRQIAHYLEDDGILLQWIQTYETDIDIVTSILKALAPEFSDFAIYNTDDVDLLIVAKRTGTLPDLDARIFASSQLRTELEQVGITDIQGIQSRFLGNKKLLVPLINANPVPANSDYFPFVDLNAPKARILGHSAVELTHLQSLEVPFFDLLRGHVDERDRTIASPRPLSSRDQLVERAVALRDAIREKNLNLLPSALSRTLLTIDSSREHCSQPAARAAWIDAVHLLAANTTTPLLPRELEDVWTHILRTPCATSDLSNGERMVLDLLHVIALRDATTIAARGKAYLASSESKDRPNAWAVIATAASQLAIDSPEEAAATMNIGVGKFRPTQPELLAAKWLSALANDRISRRQVPE